jgi:fructosamine-3-kinase
MASEPDAAFLALEWIETRLSSDPARFDRNFGEGLAALHQSVPLEDIGFGLSQPNYIGLLPQRNDPLPDWSAFYRERRLLPQIEMARERGHLPERRERMLMQVVERLETLLDGLDSRPALLHGDLWSGNFLTAGDEPVLLDPAVYYGEREMEIAYMELFGGFPPGVPAAYQAAYPLEPGYARRRPLHQLYPLLNHLNHFGETYGPEVDHVCRLCLEIPSSCRWRE